MSSSLPALAARVLLVDSDYRTSSRLAGLLRDDGFEVDVVRDGAAAIACLSRAPLPDVLVTELKVRFADGVSVARYGRAQRPGLRVIVLTGHPNLLVQGAIGGAPPLLLTKPLDYAQLLAALRTPDMPLPASPPTSTSPAAEKC